MPERSNETLEQVAYRERKYFLGFFLFFSFIMLASGMIIALALPQDGWTTGMIVGTTVLSFAGLFGVATSSALLYKSTSCPN